MIADPFKKIERIQSRKHESNYRDIILNHLNSTKQGFFFTVTASQFSHKGISDIIGVNYKGQFVAIEVKVCSELHHKKGVIEDGEGYSKQQLAFLSNICAKGGVGIGVTILITTKPLKILARWPSVIIADSKRRDYQQQINNAVELTTLRV
jgi:hypothetical protein